MGACVDEAFDVPPEVVVGHALSFAALCRGRVSQAARG